MKSITFKRFIFTIRYLKILPSIRLAVPGIINYQGKLSDDEGCNAGGDRKDLFG